MIMYTFTGALQPNIDFVRTGEPDPAVMWGRSGHGAEHAAVSDTREEIVRKAEQTVEQLYDMNRYRFKISPRWIPGSLQKIAPTKILTVTPQGRIERYTNFEVTYRDRGKTQSAIVQMLVETERMLPVANRRVLSGEVLSTDSIDMRWVPVPYDRGQLVESVDEISGKTLRRSLKDGQPIRYADISSEYLIEAGDLVQVIYEQDGLRIELEGDARQAGAQDDEIIIYNKETRKRYLGKVSSPGVVLWKRTL